MRALLIVISSALVGCGGGNTIESTTPESSNAASAAVPIDWSVGVLDASSGDTPRYTQLTQPGGEVSLTGTGWRCDVSEVFRGTTPSGFDAETRAVRCSFGSDYAAFSVTCIPELGDEPSFSAITLFEGEASRATVGLRCAHPVSGGPPVSGEISWDLSVRTPAGDTSLELYVGEQDVPIPTSSGWSCGMLGEDQPTQNGDQSVIVDCQSSSQNVRVVSIAGCYRNGSTSRFEMLNLGVGQNGQVGAELNLSCDSHP